ncbi:MAG: TetR/AcrR family transcriptional regulator [Gammaproteobacteria bacterium]|uniref:TetR/AcrR family transcriptional regulator n=1 Tax=Pseudomaricurvus alcaniphilus TaxID=1166482 RepID=UPI00140CD29B|nr:TetR/AcrR family transcriptional regulator [Pseudomaricurvus alcaniphilus]MBR9908736.1 TetR/AcrR family transcriptional regulator [Gammaproteobacteria bacterium]NHN37831.1 TetR/AcrR family transcriptional regulator [Pseudomaricurvus alcaniphilus]
MTKVSSRTGSSRDTILDVSVQLFAKHGFEGVKMRQIAQAAKVTLPAIYHHFGNKEELYKAVESAMYAPHAQSLLQAMLANDQPEKRLRAFIGNMVDSLESNPAYFKLLQRNLVEDWEQNHQFLVDISLQGVFDELKVLLNEFIEGSGEGMQPVMIFSMMIGVLAMRPITRILKGYTYTKLSRQKKRDLLIDNIISFIKVSEINESNCS